MHPTRNDLTLNVRQEVISLLNDRLADAINLGLQAKQAHWNVRGPSFFALHELFDKVAANVGEHADSLAERVAALGGTAEGTLSIVQKRSKLPEYPLTIKTGAEHVEALATSLAAFAKVVRKAIDQATLQADAVTTDLFTQIGGTVDKLLWLVEAHLQTE